MVNLMWSLARLNSLSCVLWLVSLFVQIGNAPMPAQELPDGWMSKSPREELRPAFSFRVHEGKPILQITHDDRPGLDGWFERTFSVEGEKYYRFSVDRRTDGVPNPRQSAIVRIVWEDASGKPVHPIRQRPQDKRPIWIAEPEFPEDTESIGGGTRVSGVYQAPPLATVARLELHLQWAPQGNVEWSNLSWESCDPPSPRRIRLGAVHYRPTGVSPQKNCEEFAPLVARAKQLGVDLLVMGETIPQVGSKKPIQEIAETIPGPSTDYFGILAKQHSMHLVFSLNEREAHLVFNTAVLINPRGEVIGKYRKVCLPHGEVVAGVAPGAEFPVIDTDLGKVGMMVCYDGFFPEVARALAANGAEIIAWPVWGCDPKLAQARAGENRVPIVSSTFMDRKDQWMVSGIFDHEGNLAAQADQWGDIAVADIELGRKYVGPYNLGDFHAMIHRHRPEWPSTPRESDKTSERSTEPRSEQGWQDYFPKSASQGGWRRCSTRQDLEALGIDSQKLADLQAWLLASDSRNFHAVVIHKGHLVLDVERGPGMSQSTRRVASVSKAICATVLAIASDESAKGTTPKRMRFDDAAFDFLPWAQPLSDPRKASITVRQLLNHTSGICPESLGAPNDGTWEYILGHTEDPRTATLAFDPGTQCGYSTHAFAHASLVCENVTGKPYDVYATESLLRPLGIEQSWFQMYSGDEKHGHHPSHAIGLSASDLARIGYCMLRGGRWGSQQIIPRWFVQETSLPTHSLTTKELRFQRNARSFSHGWELPSNLDEAIAVQLPLDARAKPGSGGQYLAFVPSLDLVIARQTGGSGPWEYEEFLHRACDILCK